MSEKLLLNDIHELLQRGDAAGLRELCESVHPEIFSDGLAELPTPDILNAFSFLTPKQRIDVYSHIDKDMQLSLASSFDRAEMARILSEMAADDRVDILKNLSDELRDELLPAIEYTERIDITKLAAYKEGTAGSIMTSDYIAYPPHFTAAQAIEKLRKEAAGSETVYYSYVTGEGGRLLGFVSLKDLILADPSERVDEIMSTDAVFARVFDDQEEAARKIAKFDLIALPVINGNDALVGIITHDDAIDVIHQEHTEDIEKFMAISGRHAAGEYLRTPSWVHFKNRAYWIVGLAALGLISGMIIHSFEHTLTSLLILAMYMPMIADSGGNTGSQSATVIVRAIALGEVSPAHFGKVLYKELKVSLFLALVLGLLSFGKVMFLSHGTDIPLGFSLPLIGFVIALALSMQVITATVIGAILPLTAAKLKLDPAVVASPALTTTVDITGLLIYFYTARLILGV